MKIAVLSGKGGTGKTTVSASLAFSANQCRYIDCDVEEPNGTIFLKPDIVETIPVRVKVPKVDENKCTGCGKCADACQFNAVAVVKAKVLFFSELCHHCGTCAIACPKDAIYEVDRKIGVVEIGKDSTFMQGRLNIGEPVTIPIIQCLKEQLTDDMDTVFDCPPGASCSVVEAVEGCDYCILVTEPTPFGLHDLKIAVNLVNKLEMPFGVIVNKATKEITLINDYCRDNALDILMEIPFSKDIAKAYSAGELPVEYDKKYKNKFKLLFNQLKRGDFS